ncbi:MAG: hypothetical protein QNI91_03585 [Arenicellales bacterium]|nr:hypothetical protein [Arenicellales bacterium]
MPLSSTVARQLCTKAELQLFKESLARNVKNLDTRSLKARLARARKLRDKYFSLAHQQDREIRGKQPPRRSRVVRGNENTRKKAQLFQEALARFEKRQKELEAASAASTKSRAKKKPVKKTSRKNTANAVSKTTKKKKTAAKRKQVAKSKKTNPDSGKALRVSAKAKRSRFTAAGQTRIQKHMSAQNRRRQAKRDSR